MDGFAIRSSEQLSILRPEDVITIRYKSKEEEKKRSREKEKEEKKQHRDKKKEKRRCAEKEPTPVVIDNSHNQPPSPGIAVPTNRIIRFDGDNDASPESTAPPESAAPLRIREAVAPTYTNTNTPTVNAREKKKRTRRGKRAGKQVSLKEMKPIALEGDSVLSAKPEVSFLDYVVNAPPTVTANNTVCSSVLETPDSHVQSSAQCQPEQSFIQHYQEQPSVQHYQEQPSVQHYQEQSSIQHYQEQSSVQSQKEQPQKEQPHNDYIPKVEDVVQFQYVVLNRKTLSPEVKPVRGRVLS